MDAALRLRCKAQALSRKLNEEAAAFEGHASGSPGPLASPKVQLEKTVRAPHLFLLLKVIVQLAKLLQAPTLPDKQVHGRIASGIRPQHQSLCRCLGNMRTIDCFTRMYAGTYL